MAEKWKDGPFPGAELHTDNIYSIQTAENVLHLSLKHNDISIELEIVSPFATIIFISLA